MTVLEYPAVTLASLPPSMALMYGDRAAVVDGDRVLSYAELDRRSAAVAAAFADAPFSEERRRSWPRASVVVCAYNAADTIDDCLTALERQSYPDFEIIVVNDGSRDATGAIARQYPKARVIDIPNGGLSAARNVGIANATGEIVAYTDADVRVDPDWLTYLVQPIISGKYVGSGGPNVVPPDDDLVAQCVARSGQ